MHSSDSSTHASLLSSVAGSDQAAWERFVRLYGPLILHYCRRRGLNADAEDVAQLVLLKLVREMPHFTYQPERSFRSWLLRVVHNTITDYRRERSRRVPDRGAGGEGSQNRLNKVVSPTPAADPLMLNLADQLDRERGLTRQAMLLVQERFHPTNWQAFWMTAVEGRPPADVGEELGVSVTAIYMARSRAVRMLREVLAKLRGGRPCEETPLPSGIAPAEVAGFRILGELGRGGAGVVYRAVQTSLERVVAVKMLRPAGAARDGDRLWSEVRAAAALGHPNIVPVYTVDEHCGRPYFSMKLVEGGSLARHMPRFRKDPRASARLIVAVARAVAHAHDKGIVHRDLKPANILIDDGDLPLVADFGVAQRLDSPRSERGAVVGTPSYMAPEQAAGRGAEVGPASDVWALGAVLYEMLTGLPPFKAANPFDTLIQVLTEPPVPPRRLRESVPRELDAIVQQCLRKDAAQRYTGAAALAAALVEYLREPPRRGRDP